MAERINRIDVGEFRDRGYLQEVNRRFLHPLGLALEVRSPADGFLDRLRALRRAWQESKGWTMGGVWDYRDDPEGMRYAGPGLPNRLKALWVTAERNAKATERRRTLGYVVQPLPDLDRPNPTVVTDNAGARLRVGD